MARFARRPHRATESVDIEAGDGQSAPVDQVPCRLRVVAVTEPGSHGRPGRALISGVLNGPFPPRLVQLTITLDRSAWPASDSDLPAVADRSDPRHFGVTWVVLPASKLIPHPVSATQWQRASAEAWDHGPDGRHDRAVAAGLVAAGVTIDDFGGHLEEMAPGVASLLGEGGPLAPPYEP